ncbi:MAG TPA: RNA polymerase sigma factor [Acidimicrobiales bacterium]|nr:RNA polymerase sigma factor [Acidimicrobiales bacterium]
MARLPVTSDLTARLSCDLDGVFAEVVEEFQVAVYTTALRIAGHAGDAEDLAAETFLRAYSALRGYSADRIAGLHLRPWLITICLNQWRNQVRAASRRVALAPPPTWDVADQAAGGESPSSRVEHRDDAEQLTRALRQLPPKTQIAVVLRHIVGLSPAEIAEVLGCPEGTARSHVSRGLDRLRTLLTPDSPEVLP